MNMHKNARLTPLGRERIVRQVESGQTPEAVSETAGVCPRTVRKWVERYRREGLAGLQDRSSRPRIGCGGRRPRRSSRRSNGYAASAGRESRSLRRSASRQPLSVVFCGGSA
jgi:transposase-like protein